ncbi:MAG: DUF2163 domain-containing protein [Planctomycetota bacterium]
MAGIHYLGPQQIEALRPRVTFTICHTWQIDRVDGVVMRYASHDKWLRVRGNDFAPIGPQASDMEQVEGGAESDFEVVGFLSASGIRAADIHARRYDGARLTHHVVDWQRPWMWFRKHVWWVKQISEDNGLFRAQVQGVERFLTMPAGRFYERECDKVLGSLECGATPRSLSGVVVEVVASTGSPIMEQSRNTMGMRFTSGSWVWSPAITDGLLRQGKVLWTSGPNAGTSQTIAEQIGREVTLETEAPFPIKAGDGCTLYSGCDGSLITCTLTYNNRINFGGQYKMPSTEETYRRPLEV